MYMGADHYNAGVLCANAIGVRVRVRVGLVMVRFRQLDQFNITMNTVAKLNSLHSLRVL